MKFKKIIICIVFILVGALVGGMISGVYNLSKEPTENTDDPVPDNGGSTTPLPDNPTLSGLWLLDYDGTLAVEKITFPKNNLTQEIEFSIGFYSHEIYFNREYTSLSFVKEGTSRLTAIAGISNDNGTQNLFDVGESVTNFCYAEYIDFGNVPQAVSSEFYEYFIKLYS